MGLGQTNTRYTEGNMVAAPLESLEMRLNNHSDRLRSALAIVKSILPPSPEKDGLPQEPQGVNGYMMEAARLAEELNATLARLQDEIGKL